MAGGSTPHHCKAPNGQKCNLAKLQSARDKVWYCPVHQMVCPIETWHPNVDMIHKKNEICRNCKRQKEVADKIKREAELKARAEAAAAKKVADKAKEDKDNNIKGKWKAN